VTAAAQVQLALFTVGGQELALDIMRIKEIVNPLPVTPVPRAPAFVEGVAELRGAIFPILDLRKRLGLPVPPPSSATKVLLLPLAGQTVGLVVDAVREVVRVARAELRPPPALAPLGAGGAGPPLSAVCHLGGKIIMVLDIERVLSPEEALALSGAAPGGAGGA